MNIVNRRQIIIAVIVGLLIVMSLWTFDHIFLVYKERNFFMSIRDVLESPGIYIVITIVSIIKPEKLWQVIHLTMYSYLFMLVNFIFYSAVIALIQVIVFKWRKKRKDKAMAKT